jgi:2-polyprenyl-6-methoxyphenol hydroxylase-like FAD-dependent oxidoreductase
MKLFKTKKYVIVGAGPVGLWTAIQLKKRDRNCSIIFYERYSEYKRKHILKIQNSSLFFGASKKRDEKDDVFFNDVFNNTVLKTRTKPFLKNYISTDSIESGLKKWALSLGCEINLKTIDSLEELIELHGEDTNFIIANGANSNLREQLIGDNMDRMDLQHIIELKSKVTGNLKKLKTKQLNNFKNLGFEYIGKKEKEETAFNLRLFVTEEDYNKMPESSFKNPLKDYNELPLSIKNDLIDYAEYHKLNIKDLFVSGQVSKLQLSVYCANEFAKIYKNANFFLVGDSAMGVPYFRALNSGFVLGSRLAYILNVSNNKKRKVLMYNAYRPIHKKAEFSLAKGKNMALNTYADLRKLYI